MPGIVGIVGNSASETLMQNMCGKISHFPYAREVYHAQGVSLSRVHRGCVNIQPQPVFSDDKRYVCVMIGEILGIDGLSSGPIENETQVFLEQFAAKGISMLTKVNGQYSACVFDQKEQTAYLISDRYGSRPVYYAVENGTLFFAPETKALLAAGIPKQVNYPAFSDMFHFGHLFGYKTLFENVQQLPDASMMIFRQGQIQIISYWDFPFDESSYSEEKQAESKYREQKEQTKSVLRKALKRQVAKNNSKLLIPLSGGLDSRFVASLAKESVNEVIDTFTMGSPQSEEQKFGTEVARRLGFPHRAFDTQPEDIWDSASFFNYLSDGMSPIYGPIAMDTPLKQYHRVDEVILAPQMCDALFGSMLNRKGVKALRANPGRDEAKSILINFYNQIGENFLQQVFNKDFYNRHIKDHWKTVPQQYITHYQHPLHCYFMILYKEHVRRCTLSGNLLYNIYFDTRMPSYDNDLIDLSMHIPMPFKENQKIYRFAFAEMFPGLAKIKRQGTHLPIDAPDYMIDMLRLGDKFLIKAKGLPLVEKISNKLIPPSYISFNQWFKFTLRDKLHALLLDKRTLERGIFDPKGVETLLRLHDRSTEDHSRLLWQMVNLEYFFRNFID